MAEKIFTELETFLLTIEQVALLLIFIFIGYFLRKREVITDGGKKVLAGLLVNIFAPAYSIASLSTQLSADKINEYLVYFLVGTLVSILMIFLARILARIFAKEKFHRNILKYAFAFGNIGYFGYPVVGGIFGEQMKALMILFCIPMSICINTYGYTVLTERVDLDANIEKRSFTEKFRFLYAAPFIGTMIGLILGLLPITIPSFFINLLNVAGNCQSATAMLLSGAVLAGVPFIKLFTSIKPYLIGVIRIIGLPLITGGIFSLINLLGVSGDIFIIVARLSIIVSAMPVGMNVVVYPESKGIDSTEGAKTCFLSYILALGLLPLAFMFMEMLLSSF